MPQMLTKVHIRNQIKQARKRFSAAYIQDASWQIAQVITKCRSFKEAEVVFLYAAFEEEIQTDCLAEWAKNEGKKTAYPKIQPGLEEMLFYEVEDIKELQLQTFKSLQIYEPDPKRHPLISPGAKDLIIVPGLAFDKEGHRIGYGGGFYDKYLKKYPRTFKVGVCMDFQLLEELPSESFDVKMDAVITPTKGYLPF